MFREKSGPAVSMYWNKDFMSYPMENSTFGLSQMVGTMEDNFFSCSFLRQVSNRQNQSSV